jgi:LCP family protein required for cell wall assembly
MAGDPSEHPAPPKTSRTWPQRLIIAGAFVGAIATFAAAGVLYAGQRVIEDRNIAPPLLSPGPTTTFAATNTTIAGEQPVDTPAPTFPDAEPGAKNFLITGADNNSCVDPNSPFAPAFGDRSKLGERSDTIMMWRVNPATSQVAVLSFPRDLWVKIAGRSGTQRINAAYKRDDPQQLIDTLYQDFGVPTDHFIQVDFCAFKTLVDAVGGITVPFATPVRDRATGLDVPDAGCYTFNGDHALAYVRSRKLESYIDGKGWVKDGTSDLGRISRQQDFLRRTVDRLLAKGAFNPDVAGGLIKTLSDYVVTDSELTPRKLLEFAGVMSKVDPKKITTYQIEARGTTIQGNSVLIPQLGGDNMKAVLAVFQGKATLGEAPDQVFSTTVPPTEPAGGVIEIGPGTTSTTTTLPSGSHLTPTSAAPDVSRRTPAPGWRAHPTARQRW